MKQVLIAIALVLVATPAFAQQAESTDAPIAVQPSTTVTVVNHDGSVIMTTTDPSGVGSNATATVAAAPSATTTSIVREDSGVVLMQNGVEYARLTNAPASAAAVHEPTATQVVAVMNADGSSTQTIVDQNGTTVATIRIESNVNNRVSQDAK